MVTTLVPEVIEELRETYNRGDILVVAGGVVPPDHYQFLKDAGCFDVYGPGTKIPHAAKTIITRLMQRGSDQRRRSVDPLGRPVNDQDRRNTTNTFVCGGTITGRVHIS